MQNLHFVAWKVRLSTEGLLSHDLIAHRLRIDLVKEHAIFSCNGTVLGTVNCCLRVTLCPGCSVDHSYKLNNK